MDVILDKASEMSEFIYLYAELYVIPLVFMLFVSAMTLYRRETNYHHCRSIEYVGGRTSHHGHRSDSTAEALGCRSVCEGDGIDGEGQRENLRQLHIQESKHVDIEHTKYLIRVILGDLLSWKWNGDTKDACQTVASSLARYAHQTFLGASFILPHRHTGIENSPAHLLPDMFPADVQVNILSFLHPKDVVTFACTSKACRNIVDGNGPTTAALWKTLWYRDYSWIIHSWDIGREAYARSNVCQPAYTKEFYFRFALGYLNYLLAGKNNEERCLVGIHGNIYDLTEFVSRHPGSPETLFVHAGIDASKYFDDMNHSRGARRLSREFCIAVDKSYAGSFGLRPTAVFRADGPTPPIVEADPIISKKELRHLRREGLKKVHDTFRDEARQHKKKFKEGIIEDDNVLHWNTFYDPFLEEFQGWYTTRRFKTVFVQQIGAA